MSFPGDGALIHVHFRIEVRLIVTDRDKERVFGKV